MVHRSVSILLAIPVPARCRRHQTVQRSPAFLGDELLALLHGKPFSSARLLDQFFPDAFALQNQFD
jgi:hypothetical protein